MHPLLKNNNGKINQTVTKIKHVLGIFQCLKYIYKSACVPPAVLLYLLQEVGFMAE